MNISRTECRTKCDEFSIKIYNEMDRRDTAESGDGGRQREKESLYFFIFLLLTRAQSESFWIWMSRALVTRWTVNEHIVTCNNNNTHLENQYRFNVRTSVWIQIKSTREHHTHSFFFFVSETNSFEMWTIERTHVHIILWIKVSIVEWPLAQTMFYWMEYFNVKSLLLW